MKGNHVRWVARGAALLAVLLFNAAQARAEGPEIGGGVDVGFGLLDRESTDTRQLESAGAARLSAALQRGAFTGEAEIGFTDDAAVDYTEHALTWQAGEAVQLTFSGSAFGVPGVDGMLGVVAGEGVGPVGNLDVFFDYSDNGLFNLNVGREGGVVFGVAVSDTCVPECGNDGQGGFADAERNTLILTVRDEAAALKWQGYAVSSRGTFSESDESGQGSGFGGSVGYEGAGFSLAVDVAGGTIACTAALGCSDDISLTNAGVAVKAKGFGAQFVQLSEDAGGGAEATTTAVDLVYHVESGDGITYGPQFSRETVDDGTTAVTDSYLYFAVSLEF